MKPPLHTITVAQDMAFDTVNIIIKTYKKASIHARRKHRYQMHRRLHQRTQIIHNI